MKSKLGLLSMAFAAASVLCTPSDASADGGSGGWSRGGHGLRVNEMRACIDDRDLLMHVAFKVPGAAGHYRNGIFGVKAALYGDALCDGLPGSDGWLIGYGAGGFVPGGYAPGGYFDFGPAGIGQGQFGGFGPGIGQSQSGGFGPGLGQGQSGGFGPGIGQSQSGGFGPGIGQGQFGGFGPGIGQGQFGGFGPGFAAGGFAPGGFVSGGFVSGFGGCGDYCDDLVLLDGVCTLEEPAFRDKGNWFVTTLDLLPLEAEICTSGYLEDIYVDRAEIFIDGRSFLLDYRDIGFCDDGWFGIYGLD